MLGTEQEDWLTEGLAGAEATWKVLAQQTVMKALVLGDLVLNVDQWDGYPAARARLLSSIAEDGVENVVVLTGDIHVGAAADIRGNDAGADGPIVAHELVVPGHLLAGPRASATASTPSTLGLAYANLSDNGYARAVITPETWTTEWMVVDGGIQEPGMPGHRRRHRRGHRRDPGPPRALSGSPVGPGPGAGHRALTPLAGGQRDREPARRVRRHGRPPHPRRHRPGRAGPLRGGQPHRAGHRRGDRAEALRRRPQRHHPPPLRGGRGRGRAATCPTAPSGASPSSSRTSTARPPGLPLHMGTKVLRDHGYVAPADDTLTERFRAAGLVVIGKTNTPELGLIPSTEPEATGPDPQPVGPEPHRRGLQRRLGRGGGGRDRAHGPRRRRRGLHPHPRQRLRPGRAQALAGPGPGRPGRWARRGPGWSARLAVTRSVRDAAAILDAVAGKGVGDPSWAPPPGAALRRGAGRRSRGRSASGGSSEPPDGSATTDPEVALAVGRTAAALEGLGHRVERAFPAGLADAAAVGAASSPASGPGRPASWTASGR